MMKQQLWPFLAITILLTLTFNVLLVSTQAHVLCRNSETSEIIYVNSASQDFLIRSPNYGEGLYSPNQHCSLVLTTDVDPLILTFHIKSLQIEQANDCYYDYLCLHGVRFCGIWPRNQTFQYILPEYSNFTVYFKSDYIGQSASFQILVTQESAGSQTIQELRSKGGYTGGNFTTTPVTYYPGYPYTDRCLTLPEDNQEDSNTRTEAPVTTTQAPHVHTFCSESSRILNINSKIPPILIHSPNFGAGFYPDSMSCGVVLRSDDEPLFLSFTFRHFRVEIHNECFFDYLCLSHNKFCGTWGAGQVYQTILPENNNLTLLFKTDNSVEDSGLEILVTAEAAYNRSVHPESVMPGSYRYIIPAYYPGQPYKDYCSQLLEQPSAFLPYYTPTYPPFYNTTYPRFYNITAPVTTEETTSRAQNSSIVSGVYNMCDTTWSGVVDLRAFSSSVVIQSPNFGTGNYTNNHKCTAVIRSGPEPLVLSLSYNLFMLEPENSCRYDFLCVNGVKFCGDWLTRRSFHYILPAYSNFTLYFETDFSMTKLGFQIHATPEFADNQTIKEIRSGEGSSESKIVISSLMYYNGYIYYDRCAGLLSTTYPPYSNGSTPTYPSYSNETVTTPRYPSYSNETVTTPRYPSYSNETVTTPRYPSYSNETGSTTRYPSYSNATVSTATPTQETNMTDVYNFCDQNHTVWASPATSFLLRSPNFSGVYGNNQYCNIVIRTSWQPMVLYLNYRSFNLETQESCTYDYLCVHGVKFCGTWITGGTFAYLLPSFNSFTLVFRTDNSMVKTGFEIHVTMTEPTTNQVINITTGDFGPNPNSIINTAVTYGEEYNYIDRCVHVPTTTEAYTPTNTTAYPSETTSQNWASSTSGQDVYHFCDHSQSSVVNINTKSAPILIRSPNFRHNLQCNLVLRSGPESLILSLNNKHFQLENCLNCNCDYLCVHGVYFCAGLLGGRTLHYILPAYSEFTLTFVTNSADFRSSFEFEVSQEQAINQSITEATSGFGGINDNYIYYENITFPLEHPYRDRCAESFNSNSTTAPVTDVYPTQTTGSCNQTYVEEIDAAIIQALDSLYRARALLRQWN